MSDSILCGTKSDGIRMGMMMVEEEREISGGLDSVDVGGTAKNWEKRVIGPRRERCCDGRGTRRAETPKISHSLTLEEEKKKGSKRGMRARERRIPAEETHTREKMTMTPG